MLSLIFLIGAHWHMANSDAMYMMPGSALMESGPYDRAPLGFTEGDSDIIKVLGDPGSKLVPPQTIFIDWLDSQGGYSNVYLSADNDERYVVRNGSMYGLNFCAGG